ncbi:MAG: hypothetical protein NVS1B7_2140 [Candidatus Saccharimonadales bacterium]
MDDQLRNRFRRFDSAAPLEHQTLAKPQTPFPDKKTPTPPKYSPEVPSKSSTRNQLFVDDAASSNTKRSEAPQKGSSRAHKDRQGLMSVTDKVPAKRSPVVRPRSTKQRHRKIVIPILAAFVLVSVVAGYALVARSHKFRQAASTKQLRTSAAAPSPTKVPAKNIRIVAVGDSLSYNSINQAALTTGSYNYAPLMLAIKPLMDKADIKICSQAVPAGASAVGSISGPPTFNAPTQFAKGLEDTGCNVIDLASTDANDKGQPAIDTTIRNYDQHPNILAFAGINRSAEEQKKIRYFTISGLKFAYLSYTTSTKVANPTAFGVNIYSDTLADEQIKEAHKNANFIIVSIHWGTELSPDIDSSQDAIAQHLALNNVDVVLGNGPHVIEPVKVITAAAGGHQTIVWFSLGNFLASQVPVETVVGGMAVMDINASSQQLLNPRLLPIYMHYEWTPEQKARHNDADLMARRNFQLVPLDKATDLLTKSQNNTTVPLQQERIRSIVSKYIKIPIITTADL